MKGHVGDGARSGELKAPDTGNLMPMPHPREPHGLRCDDTCPSYPLRLTSAGIGSLKLIPAGWRTLVRAGLNVTQT